MHKILIVDDDRNIRRIAEITLREVGKFSVLLANGGIEALSLAESEQPDLILLDIAMPDLDGMATFARLRENSKTANIPVILMTAGATDDERQDYSRLGVAGVIVKPFDPMSLPAQIREIVGSAKSIEAPPSNDQQS